MTNQINRTSCVDEWLMCLGRSLVKHYIHMNILKSFNRDIWFSVPSKLPVRRE